MMAAVVVRQKFTRSKPKRPRLTPLPSISVSMLQGVLDEFMEEQGNRDLHGLLSDMRKSAGWKTSASKSTRPLVDLASLWNAELGTSKISAAQMSEAIPPKMR